MEWHVFLAVLLAALLHATWNAIVKSGLDKRTSMGAVVLGHVPFAVLGLAFVPAPDPQAWGYIVGGAALHLGYQVFLMQSYKLGDLTQVYPIARGIAPLLITLVSVTVLGVQLGTLQMLGTGVIACGLLSLSLVRRTEGRKNPGAVCFAMGTGCFIAAYSLVDGIGARLAGTAVGFFGWLAVVNGVGIVIYLAIAAPEALRKIPRVGRSVFLIGGAASYAAYALVVWAFTQAPIAMVSALRETSIVFALLIGVLFLKERVDVVKVMATLLTIVGAVLLRIAR